MDKVVVGMPCGGFVKVGSGGRVVVLQMSLHGGLQHHPGLQLTIVAGAVENVTNSPIEVGLNGHGSAPVVATEYVVAQCSPHWQYSCGRLG
jgi:hypothetical protein